MTLTLTTALRKAQREYRQASAELDAINRLRLDRWHAAGCHIRQGMGQDEIDACHEIQASIDHETKYDKAVFHLHHCEAELFRKARDLMRSRQFDRVARAAGLDAKMLDDVFCSGTRQGNLRPEIISICLSL